MSHTMAITVSTQHLPRLSLGLLQILHIFALQKGPQNAQLPADLADFAPADTACLQHPLEAAVLALEVVDAL